MDDQSREEEEKRQMLNVKSEVTCGVGVGWGDPISQG
jgi:hypothetical protein